MNFICLRLTKNILTRKELSVSLHDDDNGAFAKYGKKIKLYIPLFAE